MQFKIPKKEFVSLRVYDISGKEISILVNESLKPGIYEVSFNGSLLSSGVYLYQLTAADFKEVKKMILVK
jgi:hypothetical protein